MPITHSWSGNGLSAGTTITTATAGSGDTVFNTVTNTSTVHASGTSSPRIEFAASSTLSRVSWNFTSRTVMAVRWYAEWSAAPPATVGILQGLTSGQSAQSFRVELLTTGIVRLRNAANTLVADTSQAISFPSGEIRVEVILDNGAAQVAVYQGHSTSALSTVSGTVGSAHDAIRFGGAANVANYQAHYIDDLALSDTASFIGPTGVAPPTVYSKVWKGAALVEGALTTSTAGAGDSVFNQINGSPLVSATGSRPSRIMFPASDSLARVTWYVPDTTKVATRWYAEWSAAPPATVGILQGLTGTHTTQSFRVELLQTGVIRLRNAANTTVADSAQALSFPTGSVRISVTINGGTAQVRVYSGDSSTLVVTVSGVVGTNHDALRYGGAANVVGYQSHYIDELVYEDTGTEIAASTDPLEIIKKLSADALAVGTQTVSRVYAGTKLIWGLGQDGTDNVSQTFALVMDEQFSGGALNSSNWTPYNNSTFGAPSRIQRYMAANVVVGAGSAGSTGGTSLKLLSKREAVGGNDFTAGMIDSKTSGMYFPRYGKYEARMKIPHGQGLWPAFWLTAKNGGATMCEVDIMEYFHSQVPGKTLWTLHRTDNGGTPQYNVHKNYGGTFFENPTLTPGWHTIAVEILPENGDPDNPTSNVRFKGYLNGVLAWNYLDTQSLYWTTNGGGDNDMFNIYLQGCQIGGDYVGHPDDPLGYSRNLGTCISGGGTPPNMCRTTIGGITMNAPTFSDPSSTFEIDYVKVWRFVG